MMASGAQANCVCNENLHFVIDAAQRHRETINALLAALRAERDHMILQIQNNYVAA